MASKIIVVQRRKNTTNIPSSLHEEAKKKIGSYFSPTGEIGTGLTIEEERKYMPRILSIMSTDVQYLKMVKDYFANLTVEVLLAGTPLEVGFDSDGEPLNLGNYIKYKFCLGNPECAPDEASAGAIKYLYYIHDASLKLEADFDKLKVKKDAYKEFIKLSVNEEKLIMVLNVCGIDGIAKMDEKTRELAAEKFVVENPVKFMMVLKDPNLEPKSFIENCIRHGVLRRVGTSILNGDERLGGTIEEAIEYFKDKGNSETLTVLKARLNEFKS